MPKQATCTKCGQGFLAMPALPNVPRKVGVFTTARTPSPGGFPQAPSNTVCPACHAKAGARVQAGVVQHHFVRGEIKEINARAAELRDLTMQEIDRYQQRRRDDIKAKLKHQSKGFFSKGPANPLQMSLAQVHSRLLTALQKAELTINLKAASWFSKKNEFETYGQMYERNLRDMKIAGDMMNPAARRIDADNNATFRPGLLEDKRYGGIKRVMDVGAIEADGLNASISNRLFNPKSRQVFASLNFGRRPHSFLAWGRSYLVLNEDFKKKALFFGSDTFAGTQGVKNARENAATQETLASLFYWAGSGPISDEQSGPTGSTNLQRDLYDACVLGLELPDDALDVMRTIEVHIFDVVAFRSGVAELRLSRAEVEGSKKANLFQWAQEFASRNKVKLTILQDV